MKAKKLLLIVPFLVIIFSSCTLPCGSFPSKLAGQWVPYKKGDVLKFQCKESIIEFKIDSTFKTKPYSRDLISEERCYATYLVSSSKNDYPFLKAKCTVSTEGGDGYMSILYSIYTDKGKENLFNFSYNYKDDNDPRYKKIPFVLDTIKYNLGTYNLDDVLVVGSYRDRVVIPKIYLHKAKGLVGFTTVDGKEYKLVE